ncbi:MAG: nucleotidyltransferase domain-containing protein [Rubrivivax sp.]|nr:nucleotidyltransferase domain-containing protein [Rubrivivax sp.]
MHPIVATRREQLAELCRRRGVKRLDLIGSAARTDFDEARSDIDFVVDLGADPSVSPLDAYFDLKDALEALFDRPVDLISEGSVVNPYVRASIERDRQVVFAG